MSPSESSGPDGELSLRYKWHETGSGHVESTDKAVLSVKGNHILFTVSHIVDKAFGASAEDIKEYVILPSELEELIVKYGKKES